MSSRRSRQSGSGHGSSSRSGGSRRSTTQVSDGFIFVTLPFSLLVSLDFLFQYESHRAISISIIRAFTFLFHHSFSRPKFCRLIIYLAAINGPTHRIPQHPSHQHPHRTLPHRARRCCRLRGRPTPLPGTDDFGMDTLRPIPPTAQRVTRSYP